MGLAFQCPDKKERPDCPFNKYRELPASQKYEVMISLSMKEKLELENIHKRCSNSKI